MILSVRAFLILALNVNPSFAKTVAEPLEVFFQNFTGKPQGDSCYQSSASNADRCSKFKLSDSEFQTLTSQLKNVIRTGMLNTKEHAEPPYTGGYLEKYKPFDGSYDFHSSVHAHWALLSLARVTNDETLKREMFGRLTADRLKAVAQALLHPPDPTKEENYGAFWFLILLRELEKHETYPDKSQLKALREQVETKLVSWLEKPSMPSYWANGEGYQSKYKDMYQRGDHFSWSHLFWLIKKSDPVSQDVKTRLSVLEKTRWPRVKRQLSTYKGVDWDFVYNPAQVSLIEQFGSEKPTVLYSAPPPPAIPTEVKFDNVHRLGPDLIHNWALADDIANGNVTACLTFYQRLRDVANNEGVWKKNFLLASHWTPQFIWFGLINARGEF